MTQPSLRPPSNLQPRPKAVPTFSSTSIAAKSTSAPPPRSRPSSRSRQSSPARSIGPSDVSDKATAVLIRRVLCPQSHAEPRPIDELLPPLTSSNDVDLQLYAVIAVVVKDLVYSWYGKMTPDQSFVEEVVRIVAHCTRALESRLRMVDLEGLIFDEIPELIEGHIHAYRVSHQLQHLTALPLSPVLDPADPSNVTKQQEHEAEYRQLLVQGALAVLLPTEDLENACLRTLVADVIADSILGNSIGGKVCEGWFIWGGITKLVEAVKARIEPTATGEEMEVDTRSRLEKFGLLSETRQSKEARKDERRSMFSSAFWRILQYSFLTFVTIRFVILGFITASSRPMRSTPTSKTSSLSEASPMEGRMEAPRPMLGFRIFSLISVVLDLRSRKPWLSGSLALLQHQLIHGPLGLAATDGILDQ
ncbi:MAG: hypothetical protein ALECFALPRED_002014 [Alectoria fallacina]|uniref:PXA domain-containing protein n=1 Tax=Alectoria fallacina TaxID=1903189 RepID=A0A8H3IIH8_9LECA|nr:MAG: hypothetical protein ALECFALPRED_002014 [Alectoria fallacina]